MKSKFCVVTPNYNMGEYLDETVQSVIKNLSPGDEYYIIDGGSTDSSIDVIKKYDDFISGWVSEPDQGYADALNKGFKLSAAPLMCWINSGDLLLPGALDLIRDEFMNSDQDLLFCDDYYVDQTGAVLQLSKGCVKNLKNMMLYGGWTPLQDACFWRRSLYDVCGGIDSDVRLAADYDLFLKMSIHGRSRYIPAVMSVFRKHSSQKSIANSKEYAIEKKHIMKRELRQENREFVAQILQRVFYGIWIRLRYRIAFFNRRKSNYLGSDIKQLEAEFVS